MLCQVAVVKMCIFLIFSDTTDAGGAANNNNNNNNGGAYIFLLVILKYSSVSCAQTQLKMVLVVVVDVNGFVDVICRGRCQQQQQ